MRLAALDHENAAVVEEGDDELQRVWGEKAKGYLLPRCWQP